MVISDGQAWVKQGATRQALLQGKETQCSEHTHTASWHFGRKEGEYAYWINKPTSKVVYQLLETEAISQAQYAELKDTILLDIKEL